MSAVAPGAKVDVPTLLALRCQNIPGSPPIDATSEGWMVDRTFGHWTRSHLRWEELRSRTCECRRFVDWKRAQVAA